MKFTSSVIAFSLLALAASSPMPKKKTATTSTATAAATSAAASSAATGTTSTAATGSGLVSQDYNTISISGGTAGNAEAEANALFTSIDMNNLAGVSAADLAIVKGTHDVAEDAEVQAFNPAIAAASGDAATALQV
jgi:hypothetical protein